MRPPSRPSAQSSTSRGDRGIRCGRSLLVALMVSHPHRDPAFAVPELLLGRLYRNEDIDMPAPSKTRLMRIHGACATHLRDGFREPVAEAQVRAAHHAYYGAIAYVDDLLGRLISALARGRPRPGHDRRPDPAITARCWANAASGTK